MSKRRRLARESNDAPAFTSTSDLHALLASSSNQLGPSAFSPTANLIALAGSPPSPSILASEPRLPLAIHLTYLSGPSSAAIPRLNLRLPLPLTSTSTFSDRIKLLSFSPDGAYLLCVSGSTHAEEDGTDDYLSVFEQSESGCIDQWSPVLHEQAARFGSRGLGVATAGADGKEVVSVRWVGEPRAWYPNPDFNTEEPGIAAQRPFLCAPPRSSPLSGAAFVAVLSSDEIVFVHLPRTSPLLPNIVCMPLHPPPSALSPPPPPGAELPEVTALSPSRRALSLTAVPTPPTALATSIALDGEIARGTASKSTVVPLPLDQPTPTSHISQLVGSLVSTLPSLDSSLPLPIAPSPAAGAGNAALKEELRAAELANSIGGETVNGVTKRRRRVRMADVGAVRGTRATSEAGTTTFLIATLTRRSRSRPRRVENPSSSTMDVVRDLAAAATEAHSDLKDTSINSTTDLGLNMNLDEENFDLAALDGFDFGSLDAAFGSTTEDLTAKVDLVPDTSKPPPSPEKAGQGQSQDEHEMKEWNDWEKANSENQEDEDGRDEWKIELSEVKVDMSNIDGPRLTVKPQPHFFASPPTFSDNPTEIGDRFEHLGQVGVTHLAFLEDTETVSAENSSNNGHESSVDLRLLVISTDTSHLPRSSLATYTFSNEPYALSEAFSHLECRKADVQRIDLGEWSTRFAMTYQLPDTEVLTALSNRAHGRDLGTFVAILAGPDSSNDMGEETGAGQSWRSRIVVFDSDTLAPLESQSQTLLPQRLLYSSIQLSPNAAVAACLPPAASFAASRPVIAASPFAQDLANRIALSLIRQSDATDVVGVAVSDPGIDSAVSLLESTHALIQAQLPSKQQLHNTSIQFDLLGIASTLLHASIALSNSAGTKASVETARGLIECAAAVRAFVKVERKERGAPDTTDSYRCEIDALWPLVGHATWYSDFVERLIRSVLSAPSDAPTPLLLHFLHPVSRALHKRLAISLLGLSSTLNSLANGKEPATMGASELEMLDLASKVVEDTVVQGGKAGGLTRWKTLLDQIESEVEGLDQGFAFGSSLSTLTVPKTVHPQSTSVVALVRQGYPTLSPPTAARLDSVTPPGVSANLYEWDAIRRCRLAATAEATVLKQCLRCGNKSGAVGRATTATAVEGVWASLEESWRSRCACGGFWRSV